MIQISISAENMGANGIETGPSAVGRSSQVMNVFNKARGLLAFRRCAVHHRFLPGPSTRMTCNTPKILILVYPVYRSVPRSTLSLRPSFLHFPARAKIPVSKRLKKSQKVSRVWRIGWKSPEGWHLCRMAVPIHIELRRSGIVEPE